MPDTLNDTPEIDPNDPGRSAPLPDESPDPNAILPDTDMPDPPDSSDSPPPPEEGPAPLPPSPISEPKKTGRFLKAFVVIIILAIAAAAVTYAIHVHNRNSGTVKKDIPYLTYGFDDTGDVTPNYPLETADTTDTVFIDDQLFEGLVGYQDETRIKPMLATSWETPNSTTWIFNLRHNVKFHSGRTMTATDVKYSLDYAVAHQNNYQSATDLYLASTIQSVTIVNPYQVKITTNGPDAVLLNRLADLYILDSKAKLGDPNAGTGPYVVKPGSIKPNATTLDLVAFNDYWGGHVYTRAVHLAEEPTPSALATAAAKGQFDISGDSYTAQELADIKAKNKYYQPITVSDLGLDYVSLNTENPDSPLYNVSARRAAAYALNIPAILKAGGLQGTAVNQPIPETLPGYNAAIQSTPYNPTKAKTLLAGVANASKPLSLLYPSGDGGQAGEIAKELDAVGFHVNLDYVSDLGTLVTDLVNGQGDMFFIGYETDTLDGLDMINNVVLGTQDYNNPEVTNLANQAGQTFDPAARIAILQKIESIVANDVPVLPLYSALRTYPLVKPYVVKVDLPSLDAGVYFWQVYQK